MTWRTGQVGWTIWDALFHAKVTLQGKTIGFGADVHLDEVVLSVVDRAEGHAVVKSLRVTNNLPDSQSAATTIVPAATQGGLTCIEIGSAAPDPKSEDAGTSIAAGRHNASPPRVAAQARAKQAWQTRPWKRVFNHDASASQQ